MKLLYLAIAGAAGTLSRYALGSVVQKALGAGFPWGTFVVNVSGCFLFGLIWPLAEERLAISAEARLIALVGFMGAFTTFSSFIFETGTLLRESGWALAVLNLALQNIVGMAALFAGFFVSRYI